MLGQNRLTPEGQSDQSRLLDRESDRTRRIAQGLGQNRLVELPEPSAEAREGSASSEGFAGSEESAATEGSAEAREGSASSEGFAGSEESGGFEGFEASAIDYSRKRTGISCSAHL